MFCQSQTKRTSQLSLNTSNQSVLWQELTNNQQEAIQGGNFDAFTKVVAQVDSSQPEAEGKIRGTLLLTLA